MDLCHVLLVLGTHLFKPFMIQCLVESDAVIGAFDKQAIDEVFASLTGFVPNGILEL